MVLCRCVKVLQQFLQDFIKQAHQEGGNAAMGKQRQYVAVAGMMILVVCIIMAVSVFAVRAALYNPVQLKM